MNTPIEAYLAAYSHELTLRQEIVVRETQRFVNETLPEIRALPETTDCPECELEGWPA